VGCKCARVTFAFAEVAEGGSGRVTNSPAQKVQSRVQLFEKCAKEKDGKILYTGNRRLLFYGQAKCTDVRRQAELEHGRRKGSRRSTVKAPDIGHSGKTVFGQKVLHSLCIGDDRGPVTAHVYGGSTHPKLELEWGPEGRSNHRHHRRGFVLRSRVCR
jgi:hypothetical protein